MLSCSIVELRNFPLQVKDLSVLFITCSIPRLGVDSRIVEAEDLCLEGLKDVG